MSYPKECPVFLLKAKGYCWNGREAQVTKVDPPGFSCPIEVSWLDDDGDLDWMPVNPGELIPLTPAAVELLAAIRAELGLA